MERRTTLKDALQIWQDRLLEQATHGRHVATSELYDLAMQHLSSPAAEATLAHLRHCPPCREEWHALLPHLAETEALDQSQARWYGGSTTPLRPVIQASLAAAPDPAAESERVWLFQAQDGRVTATVRVLTESTIAVAIETEDPQCAACRWHFRFARSNDDTEICRGTLTLRVEEPGFWEGRVELPYLGLTEPWSFQFASLPREPGDPQ